MTAGLIGLLTGDAGRAIGDPPRADASRAASSRPADLSAEVVRACKAGTALVDLQSKGSGSAACVSADGYFVTNHHVVADVGVGNGVRVVVQPGQEAERILTAHVIKLDQPNDLALLGSPTQ